MKGDTRSLDYSLRASCRSTVLGMISLKWLCYKQQQLPGKMRTRRAGNGNSCVVSNRADLEAHGPSKYLGLMDVVSSL